MIRPTSGTTEQLNKTASVGELVFATDTNQLYFALGPSKITPVMQNGSNIVPGSINAQDLYGVVDGGTY